MTVGDGEAHHGDDVGDEEEDDLVVMIHQGLAGVSIRPDHDTGCPGHQHVITIADCGGVEEGGDSYDDGSDPDADEEAGGAGDA